MALCVIEPVVFGVAFDAEQLSASGVLGNLIAGASQVLRFTFAAMAVFAVVLVLRVEQRNTVLRHVQEHARLRPILLLVHAVAVVGLFIATRDLLAQAGAGPSTRLSPVAVAVWTGSAVVASASLALSALTWATWVALFHQVHNVVLVSLLAGGGAVALGLLAERLWLTLGGVTLRVVLFLLDRVEREVLVSEAAGVIGTPRFVVEISPECSGFEGMGLMVVFLAVLLIGARRALHVGRVLTLVPGLLLGVWFLNAVRIAALVWWGSHVSPEVALGAFHSKAGWVLFCLVGVGTVMLLRSSSLFSRDVTATPAADRDSYNPVVVHCLPFGLQLLTGMVTGAFIFYVDWLYGVRLLAIGLGLYAVRRFLPRLLPVDWAASVAIGVLGFALWMVFEPAPDLVRLGLAKAELDQATATGRATWLASRALGSVLLIPVAEELAFRGFLMRRLIAADFEDVPFTRWTPLAVGVSSVVFGVLHGNWIGGTLCGGLYAYAQLRRGAVGDAILAHAVTNLLVAVAALGFGRWQLWL